jgi:hypothetical protein
VSDREAGLPTRVKRRAIPLIALASVGGMLLASCGGEMLASRPQALRPARLFGHARRLPPRLELQLRLPDGTLSGDSAVSYATARGRPLLRGVVRPAGTSLYMLDSFGHTVAVDPRRDGAFAVRTRLRPGENEVDFTAARLGAHQRKAVLTIDWQGRSADAMQAKIQADPAKYLPAASAGLNRKLPPLGSLPAVIPANATTTFQIDPIQAPPPTAGTGGPGRWLGGFELTEYYPALESWFRGALVPTPGLGSQHRIDWLYSAHGLSMEGDGVGLDGQAYHIQDVGAGGWLDQGGAPVWRTGGYWNAPSGALTFPLSDGGWSNGPGTRYVPPPSGISFAPGPSRNLAYLRSVAVDPSLIPLGSHIFIPAYQSINGGWFEADDTGGAINGRHIDVFRPPPADPNAGDGLGLATNQTVYILPPGAPLS